MKKNKEKEYSLEMLESEFFDKPATDPVERIKQNRYYELYSKQKVLTLKQILFITFFIESSTIQQACEDVGMSRTTYYDWKKVNPYFRRIMEIEQVENDLKWKEITEAALFKNIKEGKEKSMIFFLERRFPEIYGLKQDNINKTIDVVGFNFVDIETLPEKKELNEKS